MTDVFGFLLSFYQNSLIYFSDLNNLFILLTPGSGNNRLYFCTSKIATIVKEFNDGCLKSDNALCVMHRGDLN